MRGWSLGNRAVDGLKSSTDADLLALAEVEEGKARDPARMGFSCGYRDYRKVLKNGRIDVVSICLHIISVL